MIHWIGVGFWNRAKHQWYSMVPSSKYCDLDLGICLQNCLHCFVVNVVVRTVLWKIHEVENQSWC